MELFSAGLKIMAVGMGIVFCFLGIMIVVMNITAKIIMFINKYFPEPINEIKPIKNIKNNEAEIAVAIAIAAHKGELL